MISTREALKRLESKPLLNLWPEVGEILGLSRNATYDAAARGDIKTIPLGRLKRVPSVWLKSQLGLDVELGIAAPGRGRRGKSR